MIMVRRPEYKVEIIHVKRSRTLSNASVYIYILFEPKLTLFDHTTFPGLTLILAEVTQMHI